MGMFRDDRARVHCGDPCLPAVYFAAVSAFVPIHAVVFEVRCRGYTKARGDKRRRSRSVAYSPVQSVLQRRPGSGSVRSPAILATSLFGE